jgi:hypothetical protein
MMREPSQPRPHRHPILPHRIRDHDRRGGFSFIPNRFFNDGFFSSLCDAERSFYLFLVLVGDRNGISYYHFDRICSLLNISLEDYINTRNELIAKDLIAYDGTRFQVLSLPEQPPTGITRPLNTDDDFLTHDPASIRQCILSSLKKV